VSHGGVREWLPLSDWLAVFRIMLAHDPRANTWSERVLIVSLEVAVFDRLALRTHHHGTPHTMVQGTTKGLQSKATANNARRAHKAAANTKKGRRTVAPKKAAAIKQASMHKVSPRMFFLLYPFQHSPFSRIPD